LRSKITLTEPNIKEVSADFIGKKCGETFELKLNGALHKVTILGIRR
jgi:hypothetical protein